MANLNKVMLIGRLTRDPELRYTPGGTAVAEFGLAINRQYKTGEGESKEETTFVDITVWARQAETCAEYLSKGRGAFVEGRLKFDTWESKEGQKRSKLSVVAERVQFLGGPGGSRGSGEGQESGAASGAREEAPAFDGGGDDIPF